MTFFTCFDNRGQLIARCQTPAQIDALRRRGRPIAAVHAMKPEEAVVCTLTGVPRNSMKSSDGQAIKSGAEAPLLC